MDEKEILRPNGLGGNAETAIWFRGPRSASKNKVAYRYKDV